MSLSRRKHTIAFSLIVFAAIAGSAAAQVSQPTGSFDAHQSAQQLSDQVGAKFGSQDAMRQNAINPLTTGSAVMTNISGSVPFNTPTMICPSSSAFLDVAIIPDNATGDITSVYVQQDTNFDSSYDYAFALPVRISGVCGNGIVSCDAATWNNCRYYAWTADASGKAALQSVQMQDLGGCFCINNSCGSGIVVNQMSYVLTVLGGGIVGAIQAVNPTWAVSNSNISGLEITYYGQASSGCRSAAIGAGSSNPQTYFNPRNDSQLAAAVGSSVSTEQTNTRSVYGMITNSVAASSDQQNTKICTIKRNVFVNTLSQPPVYTWLPWLTIYDTCTGFFSDWQDTWCTAEVRIDTNNDGLYDRTDTAVQILPSMHPNITWGYTTNGDPPYVGAMGFQYPDQVAAIVGHYQALYTVPTQQTRVQISDSSTPVNFDYSQCANFIFSPAWTNNFFFATCSSMTMGSAFAYYAQRYEKMTPPWCDTAGGYSYDLPNNMCYNESVQETVQDGCQSTDSDPSCRLRDESVDGVQTVWNFTTTGVVPLPSSKTVSGAVLVQTVTEPWWNKSRTYTCTTGGGYDFSAVKQRTSNISNTVSSGAGSVSYQDMVSNGAGGWTYTANTLYLDTTSGSSTCTQACKTKKPATNTQASLSGTTAQSNTSTSSWQFFYKSCSNNVCPLSSGEVIVTDCQCIGEFADAASVMQTLNYAGRDLICSSGTPTTN